MSRGVQTTVLAVRSATAVTMGGMIHVPVKASQRRKGRVF